MRFLRDLPIKRKLSLVILTVCGVVVLFACTVLIWFQWVNFRRGFVEELESIGAVVAYNSSATLTFEDAKSAAEVLAAFRVKPHITSAQLYDSKGKLFARYGRTNDGARAAVVLGVQSVTMSGGYADLSVPVLERETRLGTLQLRALYEDKYREMIAIYAVLLAGLTAGSFLLVTVLTSILQGVISRPITSLAEVARDVSTREDYAVRAPEAGGDELGLLSRAFNRMLGQIQARDTELRESRQRFEVAVMGSSDGLWDWNITTGEVYFSPRWKSMLGYADHELPSDLREWENRLHPEDREATLNKVKDYLAGESPSYEVEFRLRHRDDSYRWILSRGAALWQAPGSPFRFAGSHTDITPRKQAQEKLEQEIAERIRTEEQLKESLGKMAAFRAVLDKSCIISLTDPKGIITEANENFCRISEYSAEELIGRNHRVVKSDRHPESFFQQLWQTIARGEVWRGEIQNRSKSGGLYWVDATIGPMLDEHGKPSGYLSVRTDITERKQAEANLAAANQKMVESSRQAGMAEIATGVLHNVGNVLNSVNVSATLVLDGLRKSKTAVLVKAVALLREHQNHLSEFLANDPKGQKLPGYLEALSAHLTGEQAALAQEMRGLMHNIDHIKKIVAMQQSYSKVSGVLEPMSAPALMEDALQMAAAALQQHQVKIVREYAKVPLLLTDRHKVLQILVNLIGNANQAMDSRPADRCLTLRVAEAGIGRIRIEVVDNGMGIAAENLTRIFQLGFTTKKDGHGFGLHSGANAAVELGGSLTAHSAGPGQGAAFLLELPVQPAREKLKAA